MNFPFGIQPALCVALEDAFPGSYRFTYAFGIKLKDFLALVFFMFSPNARDVNALSAALFSFDPECFTCFKPSEISDARALRVFISFCSPGVFTTPRFASIFLVLGLFASVSMASAFFLGLNGSFFLTLSVARFLDVLFENPFAHACSQCRFFHFTYLGNLFLLFSFAVFSNSFFCLFSYFLPFILQLCSSVFSLFFCL